jgi:hypothetical protein
MDARERIAEFLRTDGRRSANGANCISRTSTDQAQRRGCSQESTRGKSGRVQENPSCAQQIADRPGAEMADAPSWASASATAGVVK